MLIEKGWNGRDRVTKRGEGGGKRQAARGREGGKVGKMTRWGGWGGKESCFCVPVCPRLPRPHCLTRRPPLHLGFS